MFFPFGCWFFRSQRDTLSSSAFDSSSNSMAASESGLEKKDWVKKGKRFFFEFYQNQRGTNVFFSVQGALDQRPR